MQANGTSGNGWLIVLGAKSQSEEHAEGAQPWSRKKSSPAAFQQPGCSCRYQFVQLFLLLVGILVLLRLAIIFLLFGAIRFWFVDAFGGRIHLSIGQFRVGFGQGQAA